MPLWICVLWCVYYVVCLTVFVWYVYMSMCNVSANVSYMCPVSCMVIHMCTLHAVQEDTVHNYYKWKVHVGTLEHDHSVVGDGVFE